MGATIVIPERLVSEARRRGIEIEDFVLAALAKALKLDPRELASARLEPAEKALHEAEGYIARGDPVQASEKLYRAVEECIKALAEALGVEAVEEAERRGKWYTWLLGKAARQLAERLGEDRVRLAWSQAYEVRAWGFHEAKYSVEDVKPALPLARWLLEYAKKIIGQSGHAAAGRDDN